MRAVGPGAKDGPHVGIVLRPIGVPLPLALSALAIGSFLISSQELGWVGHGADLEFGLLLVGFVFPLQLIGSIFGFLARDPIAGTGAALTSGAWFAVGVDRLLPTPGGDALGIALIAFAAALAIPVAVSSMSNLAVCVVLTLTGARFLLSAIHEMSGGSEIESAAGVLGLVVSLLSLYTALALELEGLRRGPALPLLRRGSGWISLRGGFGEQVQGIEHEAGVRRQL